MYNRNLTAGSLAIISAMVWLVASPGRAQDLPVNGNLNVSKNIGVGIGGAAPSANVQINQTGSAVGLFVGNRAPFGQALLETDLTAPATHAWFAENGIRVFSVAGGGDGYFKGDLDIGGATRIKGSTVISGTTQMNGGLSVGDAASSGFIASTEGGRLPAATLNVAGTASIHQNTQIGGTLFIGVAPPNPGRSAPTADLTNTKLRVWGNVSFTGNHVITGSQTVSGDTAVGGNAAITAALSFGAKTRQMINLWKTDYGIGVQASGLYLRTGGDFYWYRGGGHSDDHGNGGGGTQLMQLDANGQLFVAGLVTTPTLQITGGADVAEPFRMSHQDILKGSVVIIDEENPGRLKLSENAYDRRVAGIVSGANGINPGISLNQQGTIEGGQNVALSGRVYVLADASTGAIRPGDLLTTSGIPGYAMKVIDHARAQGAVIGKAMSAMTEGTGMVLVLVTLQ